MVKNSAFTLIELLIVVAIIAILAAIAVPNFLEAQTRAKVSRAKADQRALATGLESYYVDHNHYPPADIPAPDVDTYMLKVYVPLTTPVSYVSSADIFEDVFGKNVEHRGAAGDIRGNRAIIAYGTLFDSFSMQNPANAPYRTQAWVVNSLGPDHKQSWTRLNAIYIQQQVGKGQPINAGNVLRSLYDPTNGTISDGDINRVGGDAHPLVYQMLDSAK